MLFGNAPNSSPLPDFGSWEMKTVSLYKKGNLWRPRSGITIGRVQEDELMECRFEDTSLHQKMENILFVSRLNYSRYASFIGPCWKFNLHASGIFRDISEDYEEYADLFSRSYSLMPWSGRVLGVSKIGSGANFVLKCSTARKTFAASENAYGHAESHLPLLEPLIKNCRIL